MVASARSYDVTLRWGNNPAQPFLFGTKGGLNLGHGLLEPSAPSRVDTILINSLHHGYGREVATDPYMARDANGEQYYADTRQPGFIMPAGKATLIHTEANGLSGDTAGAKFYAAAFALDNGDIVFGVGNQLFKIDAVTEAVTATTVSMTDWFTGSVVEWNRDAWMGVAAAGDGASVGAYNYDEDDLNTSDTYKFSWAGSTRNSIFWIRNRAGAAPQLRWSDRTDQDFGNFNVNFIYPNATNAYVLEIPKALVTGAGVTGQYFLFASKGGNIWGLDRNEVFLPLTPAPPGGFIDDRYGGPMNYVGSWLLVPNLDGLGRFDPRNVSITDISPAVHQGATPEIGTNTDKSAQAISTTPTGALAAANLIGANINLSQIEMYEDGMFWHPILDSFDIDDSGLPSRIWGLMTTRYKSGDNFTSQLKAFAIACSADYSDWLIYKIELATAAWSPPPAELASTTGFRTGYYSGRPPDINASPTQLRGFAHASDDNPISLYLYVDDDDSMTSLGILTKTGPFVLPVDPTVIPGRKFAIAGSLGVGDQNGTVPYINLPLSLDYRYVLPADDGMPDFFTLKIEAQSDQIQNLTSRLFTHGRSVTEILIELPGNLIEVGFADSRTTWTAIVEDAQADLISFEDGRTAPNYLVSLVCRRIT